MELQGLSVSNVVTAVADALQALHPQLIFGCDDELSSGQVRMHFAGFGEESNSFRPFAGLATARRQWSKVPEPTVIFGFESEDFLKRSEDALILEQKGVAWLPYTSTCDEIRQVIEKVLSASPTNCDQRIDQLSEEDFNKELQGFGHVFKPNIINSLTIRQKDLVSPDSEIRKDRYLAFRNGNHDYIRDQKELFARILAKYRGMAFTVKHQAELETVRQLLGDADCAWVAMMNLAQAPFSDDAVSAVDAKVVDIIAALERMYAMIRKIRTQLNQWELA